MKPAILRLIVLFCVFCIGNTALQAQTPHPDIAPLTALYNATNGPNWTNKTNWLSDNNPCGWFGIFCDGNGRVTHLQVVNNNLVGTIPAELGNLSQLKELFLSENQLSGSISPEIGNLTNLNGLGLSKNQLSGSIPPQLGNLTNLDRLYLSNNQLTGSIPYQIGSMTNLKQLYLSENKLSGSIPPEIGNLSKLEGLHISNNGLTGSIPQELGKLNKLTGFWAYGNNLSGTIPPQLGNLSNVSSILLNDNFLTGSIPPELGYLPKLTALTLQYNSLSGCIPASFTNLCGKTVFLSSNAGLPGGGSSEAWNAFCSTGAGSSFTAVASTPTPTTCVGATVNLSVSGGTSHSWSGPSGFTASVKNPSFVANSQSFSGIYTVTANNGGGACSVIATVSVSVKVSPNILAKSNSPVCVGSSINLTTATTDTNLKYQWSKEGGGFSSTVKNPVVANASTASSGKYILVATGSNSCTISSSVSVSVIALPTVSIMPSGTVAVCGTPAVELTANASPGVSYKWYKSNVLIANASAFTYMVTQTGAYKVEVSVNGSCKATSNSTTISSKPLPKVVASNTVSGTAITLSVTPNNMSYSWAGPNGFTTTVQKPKISPPTTANSGVYTVKVTSTNQCSASATTRVTISGGNRLATENLNADEEMELLVSPNPTQSKSVVAIQLKEASNIRLILSDAMGRNLQTWQSAEPTQQMVVEIDLSTFKSGMYLIVAETEKRRKTQKLMKQ